MVMQSLPLFFRPKNPCRVPKSIASEACPVCRLILNVETPARVALVAKPARRLWPEYPWVEPSRRQARTHRAAGASVSRRRANAALPWRVWTSMAQPGTPPIIIFGRKVVALDLTRFAPFAAQKGDERAQHFAGASEPLARDLNDRMRPTSFAKAVEHKPRLSGPAH